MRRGTVRIRPLGIRELDGIRDFIMSYQVNVKNSFLTNVPCILVIDYLKQACVLPFGGIVADPTGSIMSYEGGYAILALLNKGETVLAKTCLDEYLKMQYADGSWEQQYYPTRKANDKYDLVVDADAAYSDIQVDSGAACLAWAMSEYDRIGATTIYQANVALAFDFLRTAQYVHTVAHGTNLLANQRWDYVAGDPKWNTTAFGADSAECLLAAIVALQAYGVGFTTTGGYSVQTFANDIYVSLAKYLATCADYTDATGKDEFYFYSAYPLDTVPWLMPNNILPQGISYAQALMSEAIYKWAKSGFLPTGEVDYSYLCKRNLNFAINLTRGKWGGFYYHPVHPQWGMGIAGDGIGIYDEFAAFTGQMVRALRVVDATFYAKDIDLSISFLRTCALSDGRVYNRVMKDGTLDLAEAGVLGATMHFRTLNTELAILAGA